MINPWDGLENVLFGASADEIRRADEEDLRVLHASQHSNNRGIKKRPNGKRSVGESDVAGVKYKGAKAQRKKEQPESSFSRDKFATSRVVDAEEEIDVVGLGEADEDIDEVEMEIDELANDIDELAGDVDLWPIPSPTLHRGSEIQWTRPLGKT
ncbi:hypothetical protein FRC08_010768 [Ceratobasidium sp. 394]|nr:hypothetical protein FRC08_010768 [Ceratobasidium sp. 394]